MDLTVIEYYIMLRNKTQDEKEQKELDKIIRTLTCIFMELWFD